MARVNVIKTNMTAGEMSPRLLGRVDIARFQNAVATMENAWPLKHGGARRRTGSQFIAGSKIDAKKSIVRPFIFSTSQSYVLEFGDLYMRVFKDLGQVLDGGGLPFEIVTPYTEAELPELNYTQSADTMFLFHPSHPTVKLTRSGHAAWKQGAFPFTVEAHDEVGITPNTNVTLSAATVGLARVATAAAATFQASDVGRQILFGDGVLLISIFTDALHVTGDITSAFATVNLPAAGWTLDESPKTGLTPSATGPIGTQINLTLDANGWQADAVRTCVGHYVHINGGVVEINGVTSAVVATGIVRSLLAGAGKAGAEYWSEESRIWTAANGFPRCGTLFEQRLILAGTTRFPNSVWGSRTGLYDDFTNGAADDDGFSFTMVSDQQNPVQQMASIKQLIPLTYGGEFSIRGGVEKPVTPTNAQVKSESTYGIKNVRPVRVGTELLFVQRAGRKLRSLGYQAITDNYVSPDISVLSEHITEGGITELAYAQEPDSLLGMVRADGQMPTLTIDREQEVLGYARQVTDGLVESACSIPYQDRDQIWAVVKRTINGVTKRYIEVFDINADFTDDRMTDASVVGNTGAAIAITAAAWAAGSVTITTAAPHGLGIASVARIAGMTPAAYNKDAPVASVPGPNQITYLLEVNPGLATVLGTLLPLAKVWAGLGHLEGKTVDLLGDNGIVFPPQIVVGGQVTYPRAVPDVEIGIHYKTTIVDLPTEVMLPEGSMQGRPVSINEVRVRLYKTVGCKVDNEQIPFRKFGAGVLDKPVAPFTGVKKVDVTGWDVDRALTIVQDQPLPFCLLSIIKRVTVGD